VSNGINNKSGAVPSQNKNLLLIDFPRVLYRLASFCKAWKDQERRYGLKWSYWTRGEVSVSFCCVCNICQTRSLH